MAQACTRCGSNNDEDLTACFTCGHQLLQSVRLGQVIASRYEIRSRLGRGGMGAVYRAYDRVLEEDVALKVLREDMSQQGDAARRFRLEIKLARRVIHRNVCRIFEYGEEPGRHFISMELIEGTDLKQAILQAGRLPVERAFSIAVQLAEGLEAIHQVGVIHRDLKTSNIMLDATGTVRLMDFGIAKHMGQDAIGGTASGHILGTPAYMSPEQARGEKSDFRSDVYSLGVVIYELFTSRVPFEADTPVAVIMKHIHDAPPLDAARTANLPQAVIPILARALAKSRQDRFQSAAELSQALRVAAGDALGRPLDAIAPGVAMGGPSGPTLPWSPAAERAWRAPTAVQPPTQVVTGTHPTVDDERTAHTLDDAGPTRTVVLPEQRQDGKRARPRQAIVLGVGLAAVVVAILVARPWLRGSSASPSPDASPSAPVVVAKSVATFNARPWARITLKARGGAAVAGAEGLITPCSLELPEGTYTLELDNGGLTPPLRCEIQVARDTPNEFVFTMPSFDPASAARAAVEQRP